MTPARVSFSQLYEPDKRGRALSPDRPAPSSATRSVNRERKLRASGLAAEDTFSIHPLSLLSPSACWLEIFPVHTLPPLSLAPAGHFSPVRLFRFLFCVFQPEAAVSARSSTLSKIKEGQRPVALLQPPDSAPAARHPPVVPRRVVVPLHFGKLGASVFLPPLPSRCLLRRRPPLSSRPGCKLGS